MSLPSSKTLVLWTMILILVPLTTYAVLARHAMRSDEPRKMPDSSEQPANTPMPRGDAEVKPAKGGAQVTIDNFTFSPATLTISPGTNVTWTNRDDVPHTVTSAAKPRIFDSGALDTDEQFSHVFSTPGTYEYFCAVHPHMTARIVVK